jgi:outer membrane protein OmpA-like peptidoglycan-associated protein
MKHFILLVFLAFYLLVSLGFSQETSNSNPKYGIYAAYNLNQHVADFRRLPGVPNCCPHFEKGSGMGITLGALMELPLSDMFFLGLRLGYTTLDGLLTQKEGTTVITNGIAGDGEFEHKVDAAIGNMGLEVLFGISPLKNINLIKNINLYLGLRVGLNFSATYEQSEQITKPATGATFLDSLGIDSHSRIRNVHTGDIPESNSFQLFAIGGVSYDLPLNSRGSLMVSPEIFYSFNLTDVVKDSVWSINSMRFGAAIKYQPQDIVSDFRTIEKIDTVRLTSPEIVTEKYIKGSPTVSQAKEEQGNKITTVDYYNRTDTILIPKIFRLSADVDAVGVDSSGREIPNPKFIVEEFISNRLDPLLNYIFFDDNSSVLLPKYRQLTKQESNDFTVEKLYSDSTLGIYYNILNIIGSRMQKYPEAKLRLVGCNSNLETEKANKELSRKRAETVRDYLVNTWEIDAGRIKIEARDLPEKASTPVEEPDKIQENRRVEIYSDKIEVLEPVFTTDTIRTVNPPIARFKPEIIAEAGLSKWKLTAIQDPRQIFNNFEREGGNEAIPKEIDWIFSSDQKSIPRQQKMITYELGATDKKGKSIITGEKKLPLELITIEKKRTQRIGDMEIDKFSLILFDFDKSEITGANKKITDFIKSRIKTESSIEILGYTDRTGDANYNKNLSQKRAETSKLAISRPDATALGIGEEELLYNNDIPEGRFYCRTINIIVKTPVK